MCCQHLKGGNLCFPFLKAGYLHKLFRILSKRLIDLIPYPFVYLFNHLFISVWTHGHLLHTLGCNPMLLYFVTQIVHLKPLGALSIGSYVPFMCFKNQGFMVWFSFFYINTLWNYKMLQIHRKYFQPVLESAISPRNPGCFFIGEWYQKPRSRYCVFIATGV